jgi:putative PIN family toxin of toxin-antitoxin system
VKNDEPAVIPRVVFDTNTVVSALLFTGGRLTWLISHWQEGNCAPLISRMTAAEITRVLGYPKFRLSSEDRLELLGDYLPYCETVEHIKQCPVACRDAKDQMFLDLAQSGEADVLVSGDQDLLALGGQMSFLIETPEAFRRGVLGSEDVQSI